jgi:hypothetical protein
MKRSILLAGFFVYSIQLFSQEPADALRYSWFTQSGTARSQATGGAMVSLGGDLTSLFVNPAGLGLYKTGEFVLTPAYSFQNNKTNYLGATQKASENQFNFGASGFIIPMSSKTGSNWRNFTWGAGVNRTVNFNNAYALSGLNNQSSYSEKYLEELISNNVTDPNDAANNYPYGSSLAFNTYLIDTIQGAGGSVAGYRSLSTPQSGVKQDQTVNTNGGITDFGLGVSGNLSDKFYIGASLLWSYIDYERTSIYKESDATTNSNNDFNYFQTEEYLKTSGLGINLKMGMIIKPVEYIRLGLAVHTPTFYNLEDRYATTVTTDVEGYTGLGPQTQSSRDFNNSMNGEFTYDMLNPWRLMAGVSYVFREEKDITRQKGFISADIEWVSYKGSSFSSSDPVNNSAAYFDELNNTIDEIYRSAFNVRLGAEMKFNTWMVRGGFGYFGNPYESGDITGNRMNISGGLGYRNKGKFIDLTYVHQLTKDGYYPYRLEQGFYSAANVNSGTGNILLTVGFKF